MSPVAYSQALAKPVDDLTTVTFLPPIVSFDRVSPWLLDEKSREFWINLLASWPGVRSAWIPTEDPLTVAVPYPKTIVFRSIPMADKVCLIASISALVEASADGVVTNALMKSMNLAVVTLVTGWPSTCFGNFAANSGSPAKLGPGCMDVPGATLDAPGVTLDVPAGPLVAPAGPLVPPTPGVAALLPHALAKTTTSPANTARAGLGIRINLTFLLWGMREIQHWAPEGERQTTT